MANADLSPWLFSYNQRSSFGKFGGVLNVKSTTNSVAQGWMPILL